MARRHVSLPRLRKSLLSLAASLAAAALAALAAYGGSCLFYPVTGLEVEGARMFPEREAWRALPDRVSLLSLDATTLKREVEANPWVKDAKVLKNWDSGIVTVEVEERRAVLKGTLDGREVFYAADGTELPGAGGARLAWVGLDGGRLEEVLGIVGALEDSGVGLEAVSGADASGVAATVEGRRVLLSSDVGEGQLRALKGLMQEHPEAPYFDLRSPERVVVGPTGASAGETEG